MRKHFDSGTTDSRKPYMPIEDFDSFTYLKQMALRFESSSHLSLLRNYDA